MSKNVNVITRSVARERAFQIVFAIGQSSDISEELMDVREEYKGHEKQAKYVEKVVKGIIEHNDELTSLIVNGLSSGWSLNRLSKMSVSILKVAFYEIIYLEDVPNGTAINEAVNLSKKYGDDKEPSFINGLLGNYLKNHTENV